MAFLVVNADDYGLTAGVSRAILRSHLEGVVTNTSVLTVAPAFATTARWLDDAPTLGVGLHLTAVGEDPPLLSAAEVPTLVDRNGAFALSSIKMVPRLAARRVDRADLEREFTAQYDAFCAMGRTPTHLDTHHNLHLWPMVGELVATLAERWSVPAVRVPWSRASTPTGMGVRRFGRTLRRRLDAGGIWHPDDYFGIDEGGRMNTPTLLGLIDRLPVPGVGDESATTVEIAVHPGETGDADLAQYPWPGAARDAELASLTSSVVAERIRAFGHRLVPYGPPGHRPVATADPSPPDPRQFQYLRELQDPAELRDQHELAGQAEPQERLERPDQAAAV